MFWEWFSAQGRIRRLHRENENRTRSTENGHAFLYEVFVSKMTTDNINVTGDNCNWLQRIRRPHRLTNAGLDPPRVHSCIFILVWSFVFEKNTPDGRERQKTPSMQSRFGRLTVSRASECRTGERFNPETLDDIGRGAN